MNELEEPTKEQWDTVFNKQKTIGIVYFLEKTAAFLNNLLKENKGKDKTISR